ncbi:MAG: hypothetical protein KDD60_10700, partial [Bdellovibrionales bacterium]|nr:hypothetical protein [Bdellovibrionales bacterium]
MLDSAPHRNPPIIQPKRSDLSEYDLPPAPVIEKLHKTSSTAIWGARLLTGTAFTLPSLADISKRLQDVPPEERIRQFSQKHIFGSALITQIFSRVSGFTGSHQCVTELGVKATLAIGIVDAFVDRSSGSTREKEEVIQCLLQSFSTGEVPSSCSRHLSLAYAFAAEVHNQIQEAPRKDIFLSEAYSLALSAIQQMKNNGRSFAESVQIGSHSLGLLAALPMVFDTSIPRRLLKAAKHFGAMLEIADDFQDREADQQNGFQTFATRQ